MSDITTPGVVPIWEHHLSHVQALADIKAWYAGALGQFGNLDFFLLGTFDRGEVIAMDASSIFMIPQKGPMLVASYAETIHIEDYDGFTGLYSKQDMLFWQEQLMMKDWLKSIEDKEHTPVTDSYSYVTNLSSLYIDPEPVKIKLEFGPYIDLSWQSESNKNYGISESRKSAWVQHSLTRGVTVEVESSTVYILNATRIAEWRDVDVDINPSSPVFVNYANAIANWASVKAAMDIDYPSTAPHGNAPTPPNVDFLNEGGSAPPRILFNAETATGGTPDGGTRIYAYSPYDPLTGSEVSPDIYDSIANKETADNSYLLSAAEVYIHNASKTESFNFTKFKYSSYPNCTYKQLGFSKIKGHGHYE